MREAHGIVVTDVAFLPEKGRGPELLGFHETALFSVAVDSRCQLHLLPSRSESLEWGGTTLPLAAAKLAPGEWAACLQPSAPFLSSPVLRVVKPLYLLTSFLTLLQGVFLCGCCSCSVSGLLL